MAKEEVSSESWLHRVANNPKVQGWVFALAGAGTGVGFIAIHQAQAFRPEEIRPAPNNQLPSAREFNKLVVSLEAPRLPRWEAYKGANYFISVPPESERYEDTYILKGDNTPKGTLSVGILTRPEQISIKDYARRFTEYTQPTLPNTTLQIQEDNINGQKALTVTYPTLDSSITLSWFQNSDGTLNEVMQVWRSEADQKLTRTVVNSISFIH